MTGMPRYTMRAACPHCMKYDGELVMEGYLAPSNGQDVVRCKRCDRACYNAPKAETGKPQERIKSRDGITPGTRARILERDGARCVLCGADPSADPGLRLEIAHAISLAEGKAQGCTEEQLNDEANLFAACQECNAGMSSRSLPPWIMARLIIARFNRKKSGGIL